MAEKKPLPLAEIVTGVLIVIILIVFAVPRMVSWTEGSVVGNEISKLYYNLDTAKNSAVRSKHRVWVMFEGTTGYRIFEDVNSNGTPDKGEPLRIIKLNPEIQFGVNLDPPIQNVWGTGIVTRPIDFIGGAEKFYFEPSGKANATGAVYIIAKSDVGASKADMRALKILGANGAITILKFSPDDSPPWN